MSASCVINRGDVLAAIDDMIDHLPDEIADGAGGDRRLPGQGRRGRGRGRDGSSPRPASRRRELAEDSEIVEIAKERAAKIVAEAEDEAAALRRETDVFIDSRMASFESVLHKTTSQVKTARARLAERSGLDADRSRPSPTEACAGRARTARLDSLAAVHRPVR